MHRFMRRYRLLAAAVVAVVGVGVGSVVLAPAAFASVPACGSQCDGQSPYFKYYYDDYGHYYICADSAITIYKIPLDDAGNWLYLRYSQLCQTTWALTTMGNGVNIRTESYYNSSLTSLRYVASSHTNYSVMYTPMADDAGYYNRACLDYPAGYGTFCTGAY